MMNPDAIGAVPQAGVNPQAQQAPQQAPQLSPEEVNALRKDPEIAEVLKQIAGAPVPMDQVDAQTLTEVAGMVHKLGVQGAVAKINQLLTPEQKASIQQGAMNGGSAPSAPVAGGQL